MEWQEVQKSWEVEYVRIEVAKNVYDQREWPRMYYMWIRIVGEVGIAPEALVAQWDSQLLFEYDVYGVEAVTAANFVIQACLVCRYPLFRRSPSSPSSGDEDDYLAQ